MYVKEIIEKQLEKLSTTLTADHLLGFSEIENSMVILEISIIDYTLTDISRIVESNHALIMSFHIIPLTDGMTVWAILKLNVVDPVNVLRSFERFNYKVVATESKSGEIEDTYSDRLKEFLRYLEI